MNYMIILTNDDCTYQRWQYLFSQAGSTDFVIDVARGWIRREPLLKNYEGSIQLWKCDDVDEKIAKGLVCTFDLRHERSIIVQEMR